MYPTAQFLASYDAGRAQRYYLFGTTAPFADLVAYYRSVLKERGDQVFTQPPTHMFEVGRFREDLMAFPPSVTIKDWTWGGSAGYPNPRPGSRAGEVSDRRDDCAGSARRPAELGPPLVDFCLPSA